MKMLLRRAPQTTLRLGEGVIRHVFHHQRAILQMVDFTGRLRSRVG